MKKISFVEFEQLFIPIRKFLEDCKNINDALKTIFPSSYVCSDHGNELLDYYIDLTERYLELETQTISWFVFDNEFGKNKLTVDDNIIDSVESLYNYLTIY